MLSLRVRKYSNLILDPGVRQSMIEWKIKSKSGAVPLPEGVYLSLVHAMSRYFVGFDYIRGPPDRIGFDLPVPYKLDAVGGDGVVFFRHKFLCGGIIYSYGKTALLLVCVKKRSAGDLGSVKVWAVSLPNPSTAEDALIGSEAALK